MNDPQSLERLAAAIAALERQRATLGDAAVDMAVAALREQLPAQASESAVQQLKQVSVLFAAAVSPAGLEQRLDPEDTEVLVGGALARFTTIVQAHQGQVLQYAGDSLLAVFGTPAVREDDAERAVHAGLAILAEARTQAVLQVLQVRVGVHTGAVLLGGGVDGDNSIRGITVNLAARMEQTAPPGALRISQASWRQVRGRFELLAQPPLFVKGHDEPLLTYLVQGPRALPHGPAERGVAGVATPLVGRALPLSRLQQVYTTLCMADGLQCVAVVGDAGLGKTRLVAELQQWTAAQARGALWLQALASEQRQRQPYAMLRALIAGHIGLLDSDPPALAREKWRSALAPLLPHPADAALLGHLLGLDFADDAEVQSLRGDTRQLRDRAFFHASQWLRALARSGTPLIALFDDLHWADDGTLDFIAHLLARHTDLPLLVLGLTRPTLDERGRAPLHTTLRIELEPLDAQHAGELAGALLARLETLPESAPRPTGTSSAPRGGSSRPAEPDRLETLHTLIAEQAEGNPFYMEELVNMLLDQGVIVSDAGDGDRWQFQPERLRSVTVPGTLVGVLQARLDTLPAPERRAAQLASVVGYRFWDHSLVALGLPMPQALQGLAERGLVRPQPQSSLEGLQEWAFKHHTLHQVAYDSVLRRTRRAVHAQVAHWLLGLPGAAPADLVAEHLERGGEPAQALEQWQRAAESAAARYAHAPALAHAERALALAPADELQRRYTLTLLRCRVLALQSERAQLDPALDTLLALARQLGDTVQLSEALSQRSRYCFDGGDMLQAAALAQQAVDVVAAGAPAAAGRARAALAQCLSRLGRHEAAQRESATALALARAGGATAHEGMILNDMGMRADEQGDHGAAMALYEQALRCHREVGNRNNEGGTLSNLGYAALMLGDYEAACAQFEQARELFAHIGQRQNEAITLINLGIARLNQGRPADALAQAQPAARMLRATGDRWAEGAALRLLGQAALALHDTALALQQLRASAALFDEIGLPHLALEAVGGLAEEALLRGDLAAALAHVERVLAGQAAGVSLDGTEEPMRLQLACWRVLHTAQDPRAAPLLQAAHLTLQERAARIADAARRQAYLHDVPHHRALVAAFAGLRA